MKKKTPARHPAFWTLLSFLLTIMLLLQPITPLIAQSDIRLQLPAPTVEQSSVLYRTRITVQHQSDWAQIEQLGVKQLASGDDWAVMIVDQAMLAELARKQLKPRETTELSTLVQANAQVNPALARTLKPLLAEANTLEAASRNADIETAGLFTLVDGLDSETLGALSRVPTADGDGDGLTDTEEAYWCTDPNNPNSDGDIDGYSDGFEVNAILDTTIPRQTRWGYRTPYDAWPDFNGADGDPNTAPCDDDDKDSLPDDAEKYVVGSDDFAESTDGDKFDDGQELFGITYCTPNGGDNCGYGLLPRNYDYENDYITDQMPSWVEPPGDNLFVAAFPQPRISIIPDSWTVERVTVITTQQGQMTQSSNSYAAAVTRGQSTSIANTVSWNEWEEVSQSVETPLNGRASSYATQGVNFGKFTTGSILVGGGAIAGIGTAAAAGGVAACIATVACALAVGGGAIAVAIGESLIGDSLSDDTDKDPLQISNNIQNINVNDVSATATASADVTVNNNFDTQGIVNSLDGISYSLNQQNQILASGLSDISYQLARPRFTETRTSGFSYGGAQTTTHEEYEEHTISEGQAFTTGENWSTAWAVDSSHAANLTFNFTIENAGTDLASEINGVIVNIYLGDDPNPLVSYAAWEKFPNGKLENVFPGDEHTFASDPVPLTLEQMKRIDLGEKLNVVVEDFSYGADENFYNDAAGGGLTVFIEDGVEDGDETVDQYVLAAWGNDSVQEVLTRYFPSTEDDDDNLISLQTPEFDGINPPTWNEYFLSDIAWWNIYQTCTSDCANVGATPLHEQPAEQGGAILFRFNRDSDRDGYKDSVEVRYDTDKDDPASHPQPEILAGYTSTRTGDTVTVLLKMANTGTFDAYGIDAVMVAPDDTVTIGNNTVGGNGRVRANSQVAIGSLVLPPDLGDWSNSTANPYAAGNYTGSSDKVYTFTVGTQGVVGQGSASMDWTDGASGSGTLALGSSYQAPLPLAVDAGLQFGFDTGTLAIGDSFSIAALTPRDTFSYTINSEPFTPPTIIVSYSDPQGSHKFVTPVEIPTLDSDLTAYSGQMLGDVGLEIIALDAVDPTGDNTTDFLLKNPHTALTDAHLYLNFVADGELVAELPYTMSVPTGPTVVPVTWATSSFSQTYSADADNILLAFWTDAEGNILDSAARPFPTFQDDPEAQAVIASNDVPLRNVIANNMTWDIGTLTQGATASYELSLANIGYTPLRSFVDAPDEITSSFSGMTAINVADAQTLQLTLDSSSVPTGTYSSQVTIRTSDREQPLYTVNVTGNIAPLTGDALALPVLNRPLDVQLLIPGSHNAGATIQFTHPLGPDTQSIHPVYVLSEDYGTEFGVGKYATDFGNGDVASSDMFGDGRHGDYTVSSGTTILDHQITSIAGSIAAGQTSITLNHGSILHVGDYLLFHQTRGNPTGAPAPGLWEIRKVASVSGNDIELVMPLEHAYHDSGDHEVQIVRVPQFRNVTINSGATLTTHAWNGNSGGILVFMATGVVTVDGVVSSTGIGFLGGTHSGRPGRYGRQGESYNGPGAFDWHANAGGGGSGYSSGHTGSRGGGGGGYGSMGNRGNGGDADDRYSGRRGGTYGDSTLTAIHYGSGGGAGGDRGNAASGGDGGGLIIIQARNLNVLGSIVANGERGANASNHEATTRGGGGGGAGGSIYLVAGHGSIGTSLVRATGGGGGTGTSGKSGGSGGNGRIAITFCESLSGSTVPVANESEFECFISEQIESAPFNQTLLRLPGLITGNQSYSVQYGRRIVFTEGNEQVATLRYEASGLASADFDTLVSGAPTGTTVRLDIGDNGTWDFEDTTASNADKLPSGDLAAAFNTYWTAQGAPTSGNLDVPVRVSLSAAGQVLLTNMVIEPLDTVDLSPTLNALGTVAEGETVTVGADVGNAGVNSSAPATVSFIATLPNGQDWYIGSAFVPSIAAGGSEQVSFEWNTLGYTGTLPIRATVDPYDHLFETDEANNDATGSITVLARPDLALASIVTDTARLALPTDVQVAVRNAGDVAADGVTVTLYDGDPTARAAVLDSATVNVAAGGVMTTTLTWTPTALGSAEIYLLIDSDDAFDERNEQNNRWTGSAQVGWGATLVINAGAVDELGYNPAHGYGFLTAGSAQSCVNDGAVHTYREGTSNNPLMYQFDHLLPERFYHVDLTFYVCNGTRTMAVAADATTYPDVIPVDQMTRTVSLLLDSADYADGSTTVSIQETSDTLRNAVVSQVVLTDIRYCYRDSGALDEVAVDDAPDACGYADADSQTVSLDGSNDPAQTVRFREQALNYRFDDLNPQHAYTLTLTLLGNGDGRQQTVSLNGQLVGGTIDLTTTPQIVTIPVPAGTASSGSLLVTIGVLNNDLALLSEIALEQVTPSSPEVPTAIGLQKAQQSVQPSLLPIAFALLAAGLLLIGWRHRTKSHQIEER